MPQLFVIPALSRDLGTFVGMQQDSGSAPGMTIKPGMTEVCVKCRSSVCWENAVDRLLAALRLSPRLASTYHGNHEYYFPGIFRKRP